MGLKRLALHAGILTGIKHKLEIHSPLQKDLSTVFENMSWWNTALLTQPNLSLPSKIVLTNNLR